VLLLNLGHARLEQGGVRLLNLGDRGAWAHARGVIVDEQGSDMRKVGEDNRATDAVNPLFTIPHVCIHVTHTRSHTGLHDLRCGAWRVGERKGILHISKGKRHDREKERAKQ
jgi:hypothetical protein